MLSIYILYFIIYDLKKMFREPPPQKKKFQFVLDKNYCSYATTKILLSLALIFSCNCWPAQFQIILLFLNVYSV